MVRAYERRLVNNLLYECSAYSGKKEVSLAGTIMSQLPQISN